MKIIKAIKTKDWKIFEDKCKAEKYEDKLIHEEVINKHFSKDFLRRNNVVKQYFKKIVWPLPDWSWHFWDLRIEWDKVNIVSHNWYWCNTLVYLKEDNLEIIQEIKDFIIK